MYLHQPTVLDKSIRACLGDIETVGLTRGTSALKRKRFRWS